MAPGEHADVDWRRLRREQQRVARLRRRRMALAAAVVFLGAAAAVVALSVLDPGARGQKAVAATPPPAVPAPTRARHARQHVSAAALGRSRNAAVPILMYHVIAPPFPSSPFPGLYVPPDEFRAQMNALASAGYRAVTLDRVRAAWEGREVLPAKPIVITFDNGYRTQYTQALPILRKLGWVAVENLQLTGLPPRQGGLDEHEVRALVAAGWELDTQGYSHANLVALDPEQVHFQVAVTRRRLQRLYGVPVNWFCYPSGHYDPTLVAAVEAAGFVGSTTVVAGWARPTDNLYELPRLRVLGGTSAGALMSQVAAAVDAPPPPAAY